MVTICKATQDIDVSALHDEYLSSRPEQTKEFRFKDDEFIKWLIVDKKVCKELDYFEWHLGNYSDGEFSARSRPVEGSAILPAVVNQSESDLPA